MSAEKPINLNKLPKPAQVKPAAPEKPAVPERPVVAERAATQPGLVRRLGRSASRWYHDEDRPGLFEFHYYYLPVIVGIAVLGVEGSDEILGTHFGENLSHVQVIEDSNVVVRTIEQVAQDIGRMTQHQDVKLLEDLDHQWHQVSTE